MVHEAVCLVVDCIHQHSGYIKLGGYYHERLWQVDSFRKCGGCADLYTRDSIRGLIYIQSLPPESYTLGTSACSFSPRGTVPEDASIPNDAVLSAGENFSF